MCDVYTALDDMVGQPDIVNQLRPVINAAKISDNPLPHMILHGAPGLGKDHLVAVIAECLGAKVVEVTGATIKGKRGWGHQDWANLFCQFPVDGYDVRGFVTDLTKVKPCILFVNEAEPVPRNAWEIIHSTLQPDQTGRTGFAWPPNKYTGQARWMWTPRFTLILATNYLDVLTTNGWSVVDRVHFTFQLQWYEVPELTQIILARCRRKIQIEDEAAVEIARRSKGSPRLAVDRYLSLCMAELANSSSKILRPDHVINVMERCGITHDGLNKADLKYMAFVANAPAQGVGKETLATMLGTSPAIMSLEIEKWLMRMGYVQPVSGVGRILTAKGLRRMANSGLSRPRFDENEGEIDGS